MEFLTKTYNEQQYNLSNMQENIELVIYSLLCLGIPLAIAHPQFMVGTLVNAALILAALNLRSHKVLPIIMLPSIGVLMAGLLFGKFTMLLVFMIPFIWVANAVYVFLFKYLYFGKKVNQVVSLAIVAITKTCFLFVCAYIFVSLGVLPVMFLTTMGLFQLYTAIAGGSLALVVQFAKKQIQEKYAKKPTIWD